MSADTKAALDDAIAAHLAEEANGAILTGYVLKLEGRSVENIENGESTTRWEVPDNQSVLTTLGLATALKLDVDQWYQYGMVEDDD